MTGLIVETRDGAAVTGPVTEWSKVVVAEEVNRPTGWSLTLPVESASVPVLLAGVEADYVGIVITDTAAGHQIPGVLSGYTLSSENDLVTFTGITDTALINEAQALPDQNTADPSSTNTHWVSTGDGVTVVAAFVADQVGATAATGWDRFDRVDSAGTAGAVNFRARMQDVLTYIDEHATDAGVVVQAIIDTDTDEMVAVVRGRVSHPNAIFSKQLNTITDWELVNKAPAFNTVWAGGQGVGTAREFVYDDNIDPTHWPRRRAKFLDRRNETGADLTNTAAAALVATYPTVSITGADSPELIYGKHYQLGDLVQAEILSTRITVPVVGAQIVGDSTGAVTRNLTLGTPVADPRNPAPPLWRSITRQFGLEENP